MKRYKTLIILCLALLIGSQSFACDDTLVMLLTSKNPGSEFSKTIRTFMTSMTNLGTALKYNPKEDYSTEVNAALDAWLEFSKRYMTNPPEEAKNDRNWTDKMSSTAKKIGEIRKQVNSKEYLAAHDNILELSNTIGTFFEAVGVGDEKQLFITTSADINDLQRFVGKQELESIEKVLNKIRGDLKEFVALMPSDASNVSATEASIDSISKSVAAKDAPDKTDTIVNDLRTSFEELRSRILMKEWFSEDNKED